MFGATSNQKGKCQENAVGMEMYSASELPNMLYNFSDVRLSLGTVKNNYFIPFSYSGCFIS